MSIIPFIIAALVLLGLAAYLLVAGFTMILGGAQFGMDAPVWLGIVMMLIGGFVGWMAIKVAPFEITIRSLT